MALFFWVCLQHWATCTPCHISVIQCLDKIVHNKSSEIFNVHNICYFHGEISFAMGTRSLLFTFQAIYAPYFGASYTNARFTIRPCWTRSTHLHVSNTRSACESVRGITVPHHGVHITAAFPNANIGCTRSTCSLFFASHGTFDTWIWTHRGSPTHLFGLSFKSSFFLCTR